MLLAIDTSAAQIGLALYDGNQIFGEITWTTNRRHTTELSPALAGLLARSGATMKLISALGVALGPGSFTSLRAGLSLAKGIALARHIPIIGIPTLDVIASAQPLGKYPLIAVIQAGRKRIALGEYENNGERWQARGPVRGATIEELAEQIEATTYVAGELSVEDRKRLSRKKARVILASPINSVRRPSILADLAWTRFQKGDADNAASLAPIYLHVEGTPIS